MEWVNWGNLEGEFSSSRWSDGNFLRGSSEVQDGPTVTEDSRIRKCFYGHFSFDNGYVRHFSIDTDMELLGAD